jgi:hypothetical protein
LDWRLFCEFWSYTRQDLALLINLANRSCFGAIKVGWVYPPEWWGWQRAAPDYCPKREFLVYIYMYNGEMESLGHSLADQLGLHLSTLARLSSSSQ